MTEVPSDIELSTLRDLVQHLLPGYVKVDVIMSSTQEDIEVIFRFLDNAAVVERLKVKDVVMIDDVLAKKTVVSMIDRSITNLKYHQERLERLKTSIVV